MSSDPLAHLSLSGAVMIAVILKLFLVSGVCAIYGLGRYLGASDVHRYPWRPCITIAVIALGLAWVSWEMYSPGGRRPPEREIAVVAGQWLLLTLLPGLAGIAASRRQSRLERIFQDVVKTCNIPDRPPRER